VLNRKKEPFDLSFAEQIMKRKEGKKINGTETKKTNVHR
jgi:hypothetical protein